MKARSRLDLRKWYGRVQEAAWLLVAAGVPLVCNPWGQNVFELPKVLLLRSAALIIVFTAILSVLADTSPRSHDRPHIPFLYHAALAFGLVLSAATLLSVDRRISLWGSYDRQQGLVTRLSYLAIFLAVARGLRARRQFVRLWTVMVWGSLPMVVYGLLQSVDIDPLRLEMPDTFRIAAMAGEAEMLGHYLMLLIPLTVGRMLLVKRRWWLKSIYLVLAAGQLIALLLSGPLSAYMGVVVAFILMLAARAVATKKEWTVWVGLFALLSLVIFLSLLGVRDGPLAPLARLPGLKRLASLIKVDTPATAGWLAVWRATRPLITARPLLGYGPETMRSVFARVLPPQLVYFEGRGMVIDRARNIELDLLMSTGMAGLITFTTLVAAIGFQARRAVRRPTAERWQRITWAVLLGAASGHLVDLQMGFDLTTSAAPFWLVLAMGAALGTNFRPTGEPAPTSQNGVPAWKRRALAASLAPTRPAWSSANAPTQQAAAAEPGEKVAQRDGAPGRSGRRAGLLAVLVSAPLTLAAVVLVAILCVRPLRADVSAAESTQRAYSILRREASAEAALELWPYEPVYYLNLAGILRSIGDYDGAEDALLTAVDLAPQDPRLWTELGELYVRWSKRDTDRLSAAAEAYRQAVDLAPNSAALHAELGLALASSGHPEEAVLYLEQAVAFDVSDARAWGLLAELYAALGQESDAAWAAGEAERWAAD